MYRALVARAIYLSQDRSDIQYAVKELSRKMSEPKDIGQMALKRLGRYLVGKPRVRTLFEYQGSVRRLDTYVDTDYAGCRRTRKSTSGGIAFLGKHVLKSWSLTQSIITLSSGEAEYYGLVKGSSVALGLRSLLKDLGITREIIMHTDASAAIGIAMRRGVGKVRHIEVHQLWLQDRIGRGDIRVMKVEGSKNPADALTKHVEGYKLENHVKSTGMQVCSGRHEAAPMLD